MVADWTEEETKVLIGCWCEENVQSQLDCAKQNHSIYKRIAAEMAKQGYSKAWKQCCVKVKNLKQHSWKVCVLLFVVA